MISHKHKIIFIHIPKCAGSSIEKFFGISKISHKWNRADRLYLKGWDTIHKIHLQHAKASDLLDKKLIEKSVWDDYFKFAFVRNPWDRAHSDYLWMMKDRKVSGSFEDYINAEGVFKPHLTNLSSRDTRADHLLPQTDFIYSKTGELLVDFVGKFENLMLDFEKVCQKANVKFEGLPHVKKSTSKKVKYQDFYSDDQRELVTKKYARDIELLGYEF